MTKLLASRSEERIFIVLKVINSFIINLRCIFRLMLSLVELRSIEIELKVNVDANWSQFWHWSTALISKRKEQKNKRTLRLDNRASFTVSIFHKYSICQSTETNGWDLVLLIIFSYFKDQDLLFVVLISEIRLSISGHATLLLIWFSYVENLISIKTKENISTGVCVKVSTSKRKSE